MISLLPLLVALMAGLMVGLLVGWFVGLKVAEQGMAEQRKRLVIAEENIQVLDRENREALRENATLVAQASHLEEQKRLLAIAEENVRALDTENREVLQKNAELVAHASNFAEQKRLLLEAQTLMQKEFESAGNRVLAHAQETFLTRAEARFSQSEKASAERLGTLLAPVGERLKAYEEQVQTLETRRSDAFGQLSREIELMRAGQEQVRAEAARLGHMLRNAPKARGRWGEQQLRNVLEQCGLAEHTDFMTEHSVDTDEGRLRPDAIVRIPGGKQLVIDAKVSLNAYQDAFAAAEAGDEEAQRLALQAHAASMRAHIQTLGDKAYQDQFENAPDYVLMFVPGEHFIAAALEADDKMWNFAFERRVLLASPTNLVAIARTVAQVWRQDDLAREAREIGRIGGEVYDRIAKVAEDIKRVGSGLGTAVKSYNAFVTSFESRVLPSVRKLKDKGIEIGKRELDDVPLVDTIPRHADVGVLAPANPVEPVGDA